MGKGTILLVDDEPMVVETFQRALRREGYTVDTASSGEEGWAKGQSKCYDVLVTDWQMNEMTGLQLALRMSERWPETRIIIATAYEQEFLEEMETYHFRAYFLRKPADVVALEKKVNRILQGRQMRFVQGQSVAMVEDKLHEFKEVTGKRPVDTIKNTADEYAVAFLNSKEGGSIYWGIKDTGEVVGVKLDARQWDEVKCVVIQKLGGIELKIAPTSFRIEGHAVYDEQGNAIRDVRIVEVVVPPGSSKVLYATASHEVFIKTDAGKLKLDWPQILAELQKRLEL